MITAAYFKMMTVVQLLFYVFDYPSEKFSPMLIGPGPMTVLSPVRQEV